MKNEIGRKLTSLTIMAIMFAGGMAIGVPSFMPEAASDLSATDGMLSVSTTTLQGANVLEIVVNDPAYSDTTSDINNGPTVSIGGSSYDTNQGVNGKWYLYVVDNSIAVLMDADNTGMEYGIHCSSGLGLNGAANIIASGTDVWAEAKTHWSETSTDAGACLNIDNAPVTTDVSSADRAKLSNAVLQNAPSLSNHNDKSAGDTNIDLGQRGHGLNASGYGSWPYILSIELGSNNAIEYGSDSITVAHGNTDGEASISISNNSPADDTNIHLTVSDPSMNVDPTTADVWMFDLTAASTLGSVYFANNGTGGGKTVALSYSAGFALKPAQLFDRQCVDNCVLSVDSASILVGTSTSGFSNVTMTESGANTGVFESWDTEGVSTILTKDDAVADNVATFAYAANSADVIITYNNASIEMEAPNGDWEPGQAVTVRVTDPDLNKNPAEAETLSIGNSSSVIPTIKMGSPLTLTSSSGNNAALQKGDSQATTGVVVGEDISAGFGTTGGCGAGCGDHSYNLTIYNTSDNSERLRILHNTIELGSAGNTDTWINVTTGHKRSALIDLPGTVVLNYDISGPASQLDSTKVQVFMTDSGNNSTANAAGLITLVGAGNARAGVVDLDGTGESIGTKYIYSRDLTTDGSNFGAASDASAAGANTNLISLAFKITHPSDNQLSNAEDYAIAADFCNFDQNNGSLVHNCIYRIEAEETGLDTGVFEGSVNYVMLNNSTAAGDSTSGGMKGEHNGNDHQVEDLMTAMNGADVTVILMDAVSGSDSVRVVYNDTDASQTATKIGAQLESITHTGTVDLDADTYEVDDMATITIVDADLNQDSSIRDTYQNSSNTFTVSVTDSSSSGVADFSKIATSPMTLIETSADSGIFVATFTVPNNKGSDLEVTYIDSRDAGSSAVSFFDTATIVSNSGSVGFDRSVYPVPFNAADLREGNNDETGQDEAGKVTAWLTVTDSDFTSDTLTTSSANIAGKILVKLIETSATHTCFTAGGLASADASGSTEEELGPLSEIEIGTSSYEVSMSLSKIQDCGSTAPTITSGDILQVEYEDTADDAGSTSTVYDSSTFDLRTGSLSVDKDVYVLGSDVVITLTDPDLNLDATSSESYAMSIIEWDSSADSSCLLDNDSASCSGSPFSSNPSSLEETGSDTGVFQTVTTLPVKSISGTDIEYGESVTLTYVDVGLSGEDAVEDAVLDVEAYFSISNFGALIELDKAVYNWTDTVYFTITAPDHNTNSASEEQIGTKALPIQVSTRAGKLCTTGDKTYFADETAPDAGTFGGEIALTGYNLTTAHNSPGFATSCGSTATGGTMATNGQTDGVSVSYEYNDSLVVVASASIAFNIAEAGFDSSAVSAGGSAVLTVVDADENTNNAIVDTFTASVYSDSDSGGFTLTLNETDEDTGIFEGTVYFTADAATSGTNLRVSEGDTVTAEYDDKTLPSPYVDSDILTIASTTTVGTAFPPLERAPAANARVVDAFGASVAEVTVDQQVQIAADVANGQSGDQAFAYLVQVQDESGVTVSLAWITGSLTAGQSMSPALSWTPDASGSYTATVFVWESVDNPTALSPTVSVSIDVV